MRINKAFEDLQLGEVDELLDDYRKAARLLRELRALAGQKAKKKLEGGAAGSGASGGKKL